jgi:hypothetical protein
VDGQRAGQRVTMPDMVVSGWQRKQSLKELKIGNVDMPQACLIALLTILGANTTLTALDVENVRLFSQEARTKTVIRLAEGCQDLTRRCGLELVLSSGYRPAPHVAPADEKPYTEEAQLRQKQVRPRAMLEPRPCKSSRHPHGIRVGHDSLPDQGIETISEALEFNKGITTLQLHG